jgi:hypothetical protein
MQVWFVIVSWPICFIVIKKAITTFHLKIALEIYWYGQFFLEYFSNHTLVFYWLMIDVLEV